MTADARVRGARTSLVAIVVARAALWASAAAALLVAAGQARAAWLAAAVVASALLWRGRRAASFARTALWLEEQHPELRYALVAAVDAHVTPESRAELDAVARRVAFAPALWLTARRSLLPAAVVLAVAVAAPLLLPDGVRGLPAALGGGDRRAGGAADAVNRLAPLAAELVPPAYSGRPARRLDDPSTLDGLPGTRVTLRGPGGPDGLSVSLGAARLRATAQGAGWRLTFAIPESAAVLRLDDRAAPGGAHRVLVVIPERDAPPAVRLLLPARDTTVRSAATTIVVDAELADDIGMRSARFELITTAGETEGNFNSRESVSGARAMGGARTGRLRLTTTLAALGLGPGGQLAIRAVAVDGNTVTGPGIGYSETRTIRVARPGEYDSLALTDLGVPPPGLEKLFTLSMLIERTERLHRTRRTANRAAFARTAEGLAVEGEQIERRLQEVIALATGEEPGAHVHNEDERTAEDPRLREASHALRDGLTELRVARTGESLPYLYAARRAIDAYRLASRFYVRGRVREVVVNTERVRLAGRDSGRAAAHAAREPIAGREGVRRAYASAMRLLPDAPARAAELLTLARVEALRDDPALAGALGDASEALRAGRDAAAALLRARRLLFGASAARDSLSAWSGVP